VLPPRACEGLIQVVCECACGLRPPGGPLSANTDRLPA